MPLALLLLVIFASPVARAHEESARLHVVAESLAALEAPPNWPWSRGALQALVLATWIDESGLRESVHSGALRGDRGRAACLGQVHSGSLVSRAEWVASMGTDRASTDACAAITVRVLSAARSCADAKKPLTQSGAARIIAMYGTGRTCTPARWAVARAARWQEISDVGKR